jgi:membrane-associated protease RseP (regulator of RpoE activity)
MVAAVHYLLILLAAYALLSLYVVTLYLASQRLGLRVSELQLGAGPVVWRRGSTPALSLALFPGGFVRVAGWMRDRDDVQTYEQVYGERGFGRRLCVLCAGLMVFVAAGWLSQVARTALYPTQELMLPLQVVRVFERGAAEAAGVKAGDTLRTLGGRPLTDFAALGVAARDCLGCELVVERAGRSTALRVSPQRLPSQEIYVLGVELARHPVNQGLGGAIVEGTERSLRFLGFQIGSLVRAEPDIGPIQITARVAQEAFRAPLESSLLLVSVVAGFLGLLNLLPAPGSAGGFLLLLLMERVRGRQLTPVAEHRVLAGTVATLIVGLLSVWIFYDFAAP